MHTVRRELASANVAARCSKRNFSTVPRRQVRTVRTRRSKRDAVTAQLAARADGNRYTAQRLLRRKCSGRRGWESVRRTTREPHDAQSRRQVPIPTRFPRIATDSSGTPYILRGLLLPSLVGRRAKCSRKWLALVLERLLYAGMRDVIVVAEFTKRIPCRSPKLGKPESRVCNNITDLSHAIHFQGILNCGEGQHPSGSKPAFDHDLTGSVRERSDSSGRPSQCR